MVSGTGTLITKDELHTLLKVVQIKVCKTQKLNIKQYPRSLTQSIYSKTPICRAPIYRKPRFTAANCLPQIGLNMHIVNNQNPDLPRTPINRGCFLSPKPAVNRSFTVPGCRKLITRPQSRSCG